MNMAEITISGPRKAEGGFYPRLVKDQNYQWLRITSLPIIKRKYKASAAAYLNLAHLGSSAKKFKLRAYPMQKLEQMAKTKNSSTAT